MRAISLLAQSYLSDLSSLGEVNGLTSIIYALLTASFVGAGFGYIFAPTQVGTSAAVEIHTDTALQQPHHVGHAFKDRAPEVICAPHSLAKT